MLVNDQVTDGGALRMVATTGRKCGAMTLMFFPAKAYVAGSVAICSDWHKANWDEWSYGQIAMDDVYVSRGYAAPVGPAGEWAMTTGSLPSDKITLALNADEALVLFDLLSRWSDQDGPQKTPSLNCFESPVEQAVLSALSCLLERELTAPLSPDYTDLVSAARARLRSG